MGKDAIASGIEKIMYAVVTILLLVFLGVPALNIFGIMTCASCDPIVYAFALGVLPVAAVFIVIYYIWKRFAK